MANGLVAGRYRLEHALGEDGLSITWQAEDTALGRRVRLRQLRPDHLQDAQAFRSEVRAAAQDTSRSQGRVLDGGEDEETGLPFVVNEWDDDDLTAAIDVAPLPPRAERVRAKSDGRRGDRLLLALLLIVPLAIGVIAIANWISLPVQSVARVFSVPDDPLPTPRAAIAAGEAAPAVAQATATTPPPARATPTASPPPVGERRRVANTDGQGVALRREPDGERFPGRGYSEGDVVTLLEERGRWARIRGDDGREGWVLAVTLVP
jgi:hypothetical protein